MAFCFSKALKELRIHLCQTGESSKGIRQWIESYYVELKKTNPTHPILIRECNGIQPRVWARYEKGVERSTSLTNKSSGDISNVIKQLVQ